MPAELLEHSLVVIHNSQQPHFLTFSESYRLPFVRSCPRRPSTATHVLQLALARLGQPPHVVVQQPPDHWVLEGRQLAGSPARGCVCAFFVWAARGWQRGGTCVRVRTRIPSPVSEGRHRWVVSVHSHRVRFNKSNTRVQLDWKDLWAGWVCTKCWPSNKCFY